jgi:hypothetical protein
MPSGEPGTLASIEGRDAIAPDRQIVLFSGPGNIPGGFRFETKDVHCRGVYGIVSNK